MLVNYTIAKCIDSGFIPSKEDIDTYRELIDSGILTGIPEEVSMESFSL